MPLEKNNDAGVDKMVQKRNTFVQTPHKQGVEDIFIFDAKYCKQDIVCCWNVFFLYIAY